MSSWFPGLLTLTEKSDLQLQQQEEADFCKIIMQILTKLIVII